jgi:TRAP-type C4-dicarboxylate transport system permease small subunit
MKAIIILILTALVIMGFCQVVGRWAFSERPVKNRQVKVKYDR